MRDDTISKQMVFNYFKKKQIDGRFPLAEIVEWLRAEYPEVRVHPNRVAQLLNAIGCGRTPPAYLPENAPVHYTLRGHGKWLITDGEF